MYDIIISVDEFDISFDLSCDDIIIDDWDL